SGAFSRSCPTVSLIVCSQHTASTAVYTLSLHDALPICPCDASAERGGRLLDVRRPRSPQLTVHDTSCEVRDRQRARADAGPALRDRKSTRLNSSHGSISYAVFCLKKKKTETHTRSRNPT